MRHNKHLFVIQVCVGNNTDSCGSRTIFDSSIHENEIRSDTKPDASIQIWQNNTKRLCNGRFSLGSVIFYYNRNSIQALGGFKRGRIHIDIKKICSMIVLFFRTCGRVGVCCYACGISVVNILGMYIIYDKLVLKT